MQTRTFFEVHHSIWSTLPKLSYRKNNLSRHSRSPRNSCMGTGFAGWRIEILHKVERQANAMHTVNAEIYFEEEII